MEDGRRPGVRYPSPDIGASGPDGCVAGAGVRFPGPSPRRAITTGQHHGLSPPPAPFVSSHGQHPSSAPLARPLRPHPWPAALAPPLAPLPLQGEARRPARRGHRATVAAWPPGRGAARARRGGPRPGRRAAPPSATARPLSRCSGYAPSRTAPSAGAWRWSWAVARAPPGCPPSASRRGG